MGLGCIFHHKEAMPPGHRDDGFHVGRTAVEMYGNNRRRPRGNRCLKGGRIQRVPFRVHIGKDRCGARHGNGESGEGSRQRGHHHLVAGADAGCPQGQLERIGAISHPHSVGHTAILGPFCLERLPLLAQDEPAPLQHALDGLVDFGMETGVFPPQITHGDVRRHQSSSQ